MIYKVNHKDGNYIHEPVLDEKFEKIEIVSPRKLEPKTLDLLFDHIMKIGKQEGEVVITEKGQSLFTVTFKNHNKTWDEEQNEHQPGDNQ
jgi:hypothetical protein